MEERTKLLEELAQAEKLSEDFLEVMSGPEDGRRHEITKDCTTIGRQGDRDFVLSLDGSVSRTHAEIRIKEGNYFIVDCGSTNGTWVDDRQIQPKDEFPLQSNQIFRLGDVKLRLRLKEKNESGV